MADAKSNITIEIEAQTAKATQDIKRLNGKSTNYKNRTRVLKRLQPKSIK